MRLPGMIVTLLGETHKSLIAEFDVFDDTELDPEKDFQESVESTPDKTGLVLGTTAAERLATLLSEHTESGTYGPLPTVVTKPSDLGRLVLEEKAITTVALSDLGFVVGAVKGQRALSRVEIFEEIVNLLWQTPAEIARETLGQSTFLGNSLHHMALLLMLNLSYGPKEEAQGTTQDRSDSDDGVEIPF